MTLNYTAIFQSKTKILILALIFLFGGSVLSAQGTPISALPAEIQDKVRNDSLSQAKNTPLSVDIKQNRREVEISKDSLDAPIDYSARDSMRIDVENKKIFLFGGGDISYTTINLKADFIEFDWGNNIVTARGLRDSLGRMTGKPLFTDGTETFDAGEIRYNFKTQKGLITDAASIQQNLYVQGKRTKFVSAAGDTTKTDIIYNRDAIFTSCDLDHPHFGIRSNKQKVVPGKLVVIGPSNVEINNIPTPLWLPFGFFPISTGASSGLIFPQGYEFDPRWGFGLEQVGWFFPVNDYLNFKATGDIFVKGTFRLAGQANYRRRYKYNGSFFIGYDNYNNEQNDGTRVRDTAFRLKWSHNQDAKANPYRTFGGSLNFQTNNAQSKASNDVRAVEQATIFSNFSYNEKFPDKPMNLSVGFAHSQNTQTREVTINAPTVDFRLQRVYPFKRKNPVGKAQWYEDIAVDYRGEARSRVTATDTTLFDAKVWQNAQYGARHKATMSTKFNVLKYFNLTPNANYEEVWFFKELQKDFDTRIDTTITIKEGIEIIDTIDQVVTDTMVNGFTPFRKFDFSANLNTKLFGKLLFKKGKLRGVRHIMTPSVGFTYSPDQSEYFREVRNETRDPDSFEEYHIFQGGIYGASPQRGERMSLNYSIGNQIEAKLFSKKDSTTRNVQIIRTLSINGNYNFAADSLNWSTVNATTNMRFFNGISNVRLNAVFDPYSEDEDGRRINSLYFKDEGKVLRFERLTTSITNRLTVKKLREIFTGKRDADPGAPEEDDLLNDDDEFITDPFEDQPLLSVEEEERLAEEKELREKKKKEQFSVKQDILNLFEGFSIDHTFRFNVEREDGRDTFKITAHSLSLAGSIQLTERWRFTGLRFGYDFASKRITYPQIGVARDLHCWELGGTWQPQRGTFQFHLRVKPGSSLDFLKVPYRKTRPPADVFN